MGGGKQPSTGIPKDVRRSQRKQQEMGSDVRQAGQPTIDEGVGQFMNLLAGGRGAVSGVPIISRAVQGQQAATQRAQRRVSETGARGNVEAPFMNRALTQVGRAGNAEAGQIAARMGGKSVLANILNSITGGRQATHAVNQGRAAALSGLRTNRPSNAPPLGQSLANAAIFAGQGGFGDLSKIGGLFSGGGRGASGAGAPIGGTGSQFPTLTAG